MKHTIYIREDDESKWQAIADKSEWLHKFLNSEEAVIDLLHHKLNDAKEKIAEKIVADNPNPFIIFDEPTTEPFEASA